MTERMSDERLDRHVRDFLAWDANAITDGPSAREMAGRISARAGASTVRLIAPRRAWVLAVALLATLIAAIAVGGALRQEGAARYEAVFLRYEEPPSSVLLVVGVGADGTERQIARLEDARSQWTVPIGVVSTSGLLAFPRPTADDPFHVHWEIDDLNDLGADPIALTDFTQDVDQLNRTPYYTTDQRRGPSWGPGERLALPWYERLGDGRLGWFWTFVQGRSGERTTLDHPDEDLLALPAWASDGSGVLVGDWCDGSGSCDVYDVAPTGILGPDGVAAVDDVAVAPSMYSRRYRADGTVLSVSGGRVIEGGQNELLALDGEITDVAWTADGDGAWLAVRSSNADPDLRIDRVVPPAAPLTVATVHDPAADPDGSRIQGDLIGLAPDDSMLIVSLDRVTGTEDNGSLTPVVAAALVAPETGVSFEIPGSFAGWIEVEG